MFTPFHLFKQHKDTIVKVGALAGLSVFSLLYIKALLHSYESHKKHLEFKEKHNIPSRTLSEDVNAATKRLLNAYWPLFPLLTPHGSKEELNNPTTHHEASKKGASCDRPRPGL